MLCVVPAAACGGSSALTKADFIKRGDAICARLSKASAAVAQPTTDDAKAAYLGKIIALAKTARADFAKLDAPDAGTSVRTKLIDALDASIATATKAEAAAAKGDLDSMATLLDKASGQGKASDEAADRYGFTECGSK